MFERVKTNWALLARSIFIATGALWLPLEAYEGLSNSEIKLPFYIFLLLSATFGILIFIVDGIFLSGYLKDRIEITTNGFDSKISIVFGDLFEFDGWKAVGVNDFFDSIVNEAIVSAGSLHGHVLNEYWPDNRRDWQNQVNSSLSEERHEKERRNQGNHKRYPIGTTAVATSDTQKILFVALGNTDTSTNITTANAESLICAVRGLLQKARQICGNKPLYIPLMGSGLSRVGIKSNILIDLILTAMFEETKNAKITNSITIVLPRNKMHDINLGNLAKDWN